MPSSVASYRNKPDCLISIVTIVFNGEENIEQTISSVLEQDYQTIEYIIIDGGSSDGTLSKIEKYRDRIKKIVSEPDNGIYDALNKGISIATGSLIGIIHCGDYYEPGAVSTAVKTYLRTGADLIYGDMRIIENEGPARIVRNYRANHKDLKRRMSISHPASFVSRECYLKYGLYDTKYKSVADYDFILKLFLGGAKFCHVDKILANFRDGGLSGSNLRITLTEHFDIREKHLGTFKAYSYVFNMLCASLYFTTRKYLIEAIIGKENYIKLKKLKNLYVNRQT